MPPRLPAALANDPPAAIAHPAGLAFAFQTAPIGLAVLDLNFRYLTVNPCFTRMYGLREEDFLGRTVEEALPEPASQILDHMRLAVERESLVEREIYLHDPTTAVTDDEPNMVVYLRKAQPVRDAGGTVCGISVALIDITDRKRLDTALKDSEEDLRYTVELNPHIPWTADPDGEISFISPRWNGLVGQPPGPVLLADWAATLHPEDRNPTADIWFDSVRTGCAYDAEYRVRTPNNGWRWVRARASPRRLPTGEIMRWYGTVEDVHEQKTIGLELQQATEELARRALQDHLTGLGNRRQLDQVLLGEMERTQRTGMPVALILFDIDHFKIFNDLAGHLVGDECLKAVAQALTTIIQRPMDLVARFGGEEFAAVLPATTLSGAVLLAQRAVAAVGRLHLHHSDPRLQQVTVSAGVAIHQAGQGPTHADAIPLLIESADAALYRAKRAGRNRVTQSETTV